MQTGVSLSYFRLTFCVLKFLIITRVEQNVVPKQVLLLTDLIVNTMNQNKLVSTSGQAGVGCNQFACIMHQVA